MDHECSFVEEQEPSGRLILGPCLTCNLSAMDALTQRDAELRHAEDIIWQARVAFRPLDEDVDDKPEGDVLEDVSRILTDYKRESV